MLPALLSRLRPVLLWTPAARAPAVLAASQGASSVASLGTLPHGAEPGPSGRGNQPEAAAEDAPPSAQQTVVVAEAPAVDAAAAAAPAAKKRAPRAQAPAEGEGDRVVEPPPAPKKRQAAVKKAAAPPAPTGPPAACISDLDYEDFFLLPRQAESIQEHVGSHVPDGLRTIQELLTFMSMPVTDTTTALLCLTYQQQLHVDDLYDLYQLDMAPTFLPGDAWRNAVMEVRPKGFTAAKITAVVEALKAKVGAAAFEAQEKAAAGLARYQAELFAQDWVSAQLAGPYAGGNYELRRCAALQLTPATVKRLVLYAKQGAGLKALMVGPKGQPVKAITAFEALLHGVKCGVKLDQARLLEDFGIGHPGDGGTRPLHYDMLREALASVEIPKDANHANMYTQARDHLLSNPDVSEALKAQEDEWVKQYTGSSLEEGTVLRLRLVYYLERVARFRDNPLPRLQEQGSADT